MAEPQPAPTRARPELLLVDDDPLITDALAFALDDAFHVHVAASREAVRRTLQRMAGPPSLALVDLGLPPRPHDPDEGFRLIAELLGHNRAMKILVLSGQNERPTIQHALTLGAVDFVAKPCDPALLRARLQHQLMILDAEQASAGDDDAIEALLLGESATMTALRALVEQFGDTPFPVLVEGESGSGKELVAECLHRGSRRAAEPLLALNCAAFSAELLEAQLFGHARGAFTGADSARAGFFEQAREGTLFLDEVAEMPLALQSKFLRVLENGEFYRLGETTPRRSAARIVAATNQDLTAAVRAGTFRPDLFHRLSVLSITVPPLRSRGDDWRLLLARFQRQYADSIAPFELSEEAQRLLAGYRFPGNVRELRNIVIRLGAKFPGREIDAAMLAFELEPPLEDADGLPFDASLETRLLAGGFKLDDELAGLERACVQAALRLAEGRLSRAARLLGLNRTTLYSRVAKLGLEPGGGGRSATAAGAEEE